MLLFLKIYKMTQVKIGKVSDLKKGESKVINVNGKVLALFNVDGKIFVIENACLHKGGPLGEGQLDGSIVTCPLHGWKYDVTSGRCTFPATNLEVKSYEVHIKGEGIFIDT